MTSVLRCGWENILQSQTQSCLFVCAETCCICSVEGCNLRCKVLNSLEKKSLRTQWPSASAYAFPRKSVVLFPDKEGKVPLYGNQGAIFQFKESSAGRCLWKSFPSQLHPGKLYRDTEWEHMAWFHTLNPHSQIAGDSWPKNRKMWKVSGWSLRLDAVRNGPRQGVIDSSRVVRVGRRSSHGRGKQ